MLVQNQVGPIATTQSISPGLQSPARAGNLGDTIVSELHGRFYEQTYRGNMFSAGITLTALTANTISLTNTTTPILGLWNPSASTVNLVVAQAALQVVANNLTSGAAPGAFVWAYSAANTALTLGLSTAWNRKTLTTSGSQARYFTPATALTGLTNNLVIAEAADFSGVSGLTYTTLASTTMIPSYGGVQNFDGSLVIPPGGLVCLLNTVSSTVFSVAGRILWEEVPL